jgi:methyl-accepting chemotaxis protein
VKSLLYPAVALMNRLSFGMKFSLISVLFLLPMLATNYFLVRDSWREFQGTPHRTAKPGFARQQPGLAP